MVPCRVCGKEVITGWICGIVPSHDTFKLGLCPEHDTPRNRERVEAEWERLLGQEMRRYFATRPKPETTPSTFELHLYFLDGGLTTVACRAWEVVEAKDLLVLTRDGQVDFYPLRHIRRFEAVEIPGER